MRPDLPLSPRQIASIVESQHRINAWEGSVRSGKTIASLLRWLGYVADAPLGGELVMVGRTRDSLSRNVFAPLTNPVLFGEMAQQVHYTNGAPTATILGRTVHALGANDAQAEPKVRGLTCSGAYVDEATTLPQTFFDQLTARCSVEGSKIFLTTNPDNPGHWLRKKYLLRPAETRLRSWHFTLDDNPHLPTDYVASLKSMHTGLFYRRNILGHWVQSEGAIYEAFDPDRHVVDELPPITRWLCVGIDHGTVNPFSAILLGLGADGCLYAASEWRHESRTANRQMTDLEYSAAIGAWLGELGVRPEWIVVDPSAASFIEQLHRDGFHPAGADNAVKDGIQTTASLFAAGKLKVHRSCVGLIEELPGYSWDDEVALAKGEDKPIKVDDHSCDALRYAIRTTEALWRAYVQLTLAA
ncbi:PBSX family phage terminase large subunit [Kitasatospora sp. P5_F3]